MSISRYTALIIQGRPDEIKCYSGGPTADGKYVGWIYFEEDRGELGEGMRDIRPRPLLNTEPIYNTPEEAIAAVQETVTQLQSKTIEETLKQ